jgi:hypothetical protein
MARMPLCKRQHHGAAVRADPIDKAPTAQLSPGQKPGFFFIPMGGVADSSLARAA